MILIEEVARAGSGGVLWGLFAGLSIGLPPVMKFGSKYLKDKVAGACMRGEKTICLAITEPSAGSDVANLQTEAKKTPDGKFYIVNGEKKCDTDLCMHAHLMCSEGGSRTESLPTTLALQSALAALAWVASPWC